MPGAKPPDGQSPGGPQTGSRPVAPTRLLGTPGVFGVRYRAKWKPPPGAPPVALAAAYLQHRVACAVLEELARLDRPIEDFAASVGADPVYLERKLHGHVRADVEDLLAWALELGAGMLPELNGGDDLLPPT